MYEYFTTNFVPIFVLYEFENQARPLLSENGRDLHLVEKFVELIKACGILSYNAVYTKKKTGIFL